MSDQEVKAPEAAANVQIAESKDVQSEGKVDASEPPTAGDKPAAAQSTDAKDEVKANSQGPSILNPPQNMLKVKRPENIEKGKNQNKFDVSNQEETSDPNLIRRQVGPKHESDER